MLFFIAGFVLAACSGLVFVDRNNTHQLFEYTFSQTECENGYFIPHTFNNGSSFGNLQKMASAECLERSGYRNIRAKNGIAAKSAGTFERILERINETKELTVEMWINYLAPSRNPEKLFLITGGDEMDENHYEDISCTLLIGGTYLLLHIIDNQYASFITSHNNDAQLLHIVYTVQLSENATYATAYINGTTIGLNPQNPIDLNNWNASARLILSRTDAGSESTMYYNEVYYFGFYDHALTYDQVIYNYNCFLPPSLASIKQREVHGTMNSVFPVELLIQDYNLDTNTNLVDNYTVQIILRSIPPIGQLFYATMQPINSCPPEGIVLNSTTLFYQPEYNEYSATEYSNFTVQVENPYGISNPIPISIFVAWVNQPPITWDCWFNITTDTSSIVDIEMIDSDGDAAYTRFLSISPVCSISDLSNDMILNNTRFEVWFIGNSLQSDNCSIQFVVGDIHGLESNITTYWFTAVNTLSPQLSLMSVNQYEKTNLSLPIVSTSGTDLTSEVELQIVTMPRYGTIENVGNKILQYCSYEFYFSSPSQTIYGKDIGNSMDSIEYVIIHKGVSSPSYTLLIDIVHNNTIPILKVPSELYFKVYDSVPVQNITIIDYDNDTQLCELKISTVSGLFYINSITNDPMNPLKWVSGNYGEGRDNSKVTVEGSLSAISFALGSISYKAMYRLNDSLQLQLTDGAFVVTGVVKMVYVPEQTTVITPKFTIIVILVVGVMVLWALSLCCKICPHKKKKLPVIIKEKEPKLEQEKKHEKENEQENEQEEQVQEQKRKSNKKKKTPPPPPSTLPPVKRTVMNSDEVNINYKKSSKPPSVV